jgi:hypothetical protein
MTQNHTAYLVVKRGAHVGTNYLNRINGHWQTYFSSNCLFDFLLLAEKEANMCVGQVINVKISFTPTWS